MSLPSTFRAMLLADSDVLDLVSTRIYPMSLPQKPTFQAITYSLIDGSPENTTNSTGSLHWAKIRVNAWGLTYGDAYVLATKIETALNGQSYSTLLDISGEGIRNFFEPAINAHYSTEDFSIWHTE